MRAQVFAPVAPSIALSKPPPGKPKISPSVRATVRSGFTSATILLIGDCSGKSEDVKSQPNLDFDDVVVDEYADVLWSVRVYGLKKRAGTAGCWPWAALISRPAQELAPLMRAPGLRNGCRARPGTASTHRRSPSETDARREAERLADELIAQPNVARETDRRSVGEICSWPCA